MNWLVSIFSVMDLICEYTDAMNIVFQVIYQQAAISQKEIVFRFRKDVQSEEGWGLKCCA